MIKVIKEESVISEQDDETLEVDLSQLPFEDRQDAEGLENTITGNLEWTIENFNKSKKGYLTFPTKFDMVDSILNLEIILS